MNKAIISGNIGRDPELNQTRSGTSVCNLSVATNRTYTNNQGEKKEETVWHDVVVWGDQAENCAKYLTKGREVLVEGRISVDEYTDRNGVERENKQIVAQRVEFLSDGGGARPNGQQRGQPKRQPSPGNPAAQGGGQNRGGQRGNQPNGQRGGRQPQNNQPQNTGGGGGWPDESGGQNGQTEPFDDEEIPF